MSGVNFYRSIAAIFALLFVLAAIQNLSDMRSLADAQVAMAQLEAADARLKKADDELQAASDELRDADARLQRTCLSVTR